VAVEYPQYPVNLLVAGKRCLVVGGGEVAVRKARGLLDCGAQVTVVAPTLSPGLDELAAHVPDAALTVQRRRYRQGEAAGYWFVVAATDDAGVNGAVYGDGEKAGVWVNAADDPASCSATLPSVMRRGPLQVAISTGGHSPALAAWLRSHVEAEMGEEFRVLLELLSEEREALKAQGRPTADLDWRRALDSNMLEMIRAGDIAKAREQLKACLS